MSNFVKLTTRTQDGNYLRQWIPSHLIESLSQLSGSQDGTNEGTCVLLDGTEIQLIAFNETLDSLK